MLKTFTCFVVCEKEELIVTTVRLVLPFFAALHLRDFKHDLKYRLGYIEFRMCCFKIRNGLLQHLFYFV